jgi:hypothetical protein
MPVDPVADIPEEADERKRWINRLSELDTSRNQRLSQIGKATAAVCQLLREGHVPSASERHQLADELLALRRVLRDNGVVHRLEDACQDCHATSNRNLRQAAAVLGEQSQAGVARQLEQIGRLPPDCAPIDRAGICQSEVYFHLRDLLGSLVRVQDLPEQVESDELVAKLSRPLDGQAVEGGGANSEPSGAGRPAPPGDRSGDDRQEIPVLSQRQYGILEAMALLKAFNSAKRQTTEAIAERAEGPSANPDSFKTAMAELKRQQFVDTRSGRGGGCWLTADGREVANRLTQHPEHPQPPNTPR